MFVLFYKIKCCQLLNNIFIGNIVRYEVLSTNSVILIVKN